MLLLPIAGCASARADRAQARAGAIEVLYNGQFGEARQRLRRQIAAAQRPGRPERMNRDYLLERMRLFLLTLGDGYAPAEGGLVERIYEILRTQGINRDRTVASVVVNEDVKLWKGEPFEQALAFHYVGVHQAVQGSWDNARAAMLNSLFQLRDFGTDTGGQRLSQEEIIRRAQRQGDDYFDRYRPVKSNFALGYVMAGIANQQMGLDVGDDQREAEAQENFADALRVNPALGELIETLRGGDYNTILVVDYGRVPQKIGTGADAAIASFRPMTPSDARRLRVMSGGGNAGYPWVTDVNLMARDHRWNSLEDMRRAKSFIGSVLVGGGAVTSLYGLSARREEAIYAGLGMLLAGAIAKGGAHADTRQLELLPQRVYVVPLKIERPGTLVELQVEGDPGSRLALAGLSPPRGETAQLRYVRLLSHHGTPPLWATSGRVHYSNDRTGQAGPAPLPYILGGDDVRVPTEEVLDSYQRAGYLRGMTLSQLRELYRMEGIALEIREEPEQAPTSGPPGIPGVPGLHVLEGGRSLVPPLEGTLGFARLFGAKHPPYRPRSERLRELVRSGMVAPAAPAAAAASRTDGFETR